MTERVCAICGAVLRRRTNEARSQFAERVCCSRDCKDRYIRRRAVEARGHVPETKTCVICSTKYHRREDERSSAWNNRKSCGARPCVQAVRGIFGKTDNREDNSMDGVPQNEGLPANAFGHNAIPADTGILLRLTRPDTRTLGGVSM